MANVSFKVAFDSRSFQLDSPYATEGAYLSASQVILYWSTNGSDRTVFTGSFVVSGNDISSGTITGASDYVNGVVTLTASGLNYNVNDYKAYAVAGNGHGFLADLLKGNDSISGSASPDYIESFAGNDTLSGGGGSDTLVGGSGNDTYLVGSGDTLIELAGAGVDLVKSGVDWTLAANLEKLTLTGTAAIDGIGNGLANVLTGNAANNLLKGLAANDTLIGGGGADTLDGGAGNDSMVGGGGNDIYFVGSAGDVVKELAGGGIDLVKSSVSFTLGANQEKLTLIGGAAINGFGNDQANVLWGNDAANTLNGGKGFDTLNGGGGNDKLIGALGNDTINGGNGNDTLDGGAGNDLMVGGAGNDVYFVGAAGDVVKELAGGGVDLVKSFVSRTLGANQEKLTLLGSAAINGFGNDQANTMWGNTAANILNGGKGFDILNGGAGNDTLVGALGKDTLSGGTGNDKFLFNAALSSSNIDLIKDFTKLAGNTDKILLDDDIFTALGAVSSPTALDAAAFYVGPAAHDASDRIIYHKASGALYYDVDGTGAADAVQFATVGAGTHPTLSASDFFVVS